MWRCIGCRLVGLWGEQCGGGKARADEWMRDMSECWELKALCVRICVPPIEGWRAGDYDGVDEADDGLVKIPRAAGRFAVCACGDGLAGTKIQSAVNSKLCACGAVMLGRRRDGGAGCSMRSIETLSRTEAGELSPCRDRGDCAVECIASDRGRRMQRARTTRNAACISVSMFYVLRELVSWREVSRDVSS